MRTIPVGGVLSLLLLMPITGLGQTIPIPVEPCGGSGTQMVLTIPLHPQETPAWCWAAVAQMVMEYKEGEPRHQDRLKQQCDLVSDMFRADLSANRYHTCCTNPMHALCYKAWFPQLAFREFGFDWVWKPWMNFILSDVTSQICANKPLVAIVNQGGMGLHAYVVEGFIILPIPFPPILGDFVVLYDPQGVSGNGEHVLKTFDLLLNDPSTGDWLEGSFVDILPLRNP